MKMIVTETQRLGPFLSVETLEGSYWVNGDTLYPFSVVGASTVEDATEADMPVVKPPVPAQVTMRQARLALLQAGKLSAVDTAIAALPSPQKEAAQIEWEFSSAVDRDRPFVKTLGPMLGLTEDQLDDLFRLAITL